MDEDNSQQSEYPESAALLPLYGAGYVGGCFVLRDILNTKKAGEIVDLLSSKLNSDVVHLSYDVARYQLGDVFAAAYYASLLELFANYLISKSKIEPSPEVESQKKGVVALLSFMALTCYEMLQASKPNASFDYKDMAAYIIGLGIFLCSDKIIRSVVDTAKSFGNKADEPQTELEIKAVSFAQNLQSTAYLNKKDTIKR